MLKTSFPVLALAALLWSRSEGAAKEKKAKPDEQARKVCEQFGKAVFTKNLDGAIKLVAGPWYDNYEGTGRGRVTRGADEVNKRLKKLFGEIPAAKHVGMEVLDNLTYEQAAEKLKAEERQILDGVLKKTDRVLAVRISRDGKKGSRLIMLVGWRDGQAKVVGIHDP